MKRLIAAMSVLGLAACATGPEAPADFDPTACYERSFNLYFEPQEADLNPAAREAISTVQNELRGCRIDGVRVLGLAEAAGATAENFELSRQRALRIEDFMELDPAWRDKIETLAAGEAGAVTEEGPRPMRRVARITVRASAP